MPRLTLEHAASLALAELALKRYESTASIDARRRYAYDPHAYARDAYGYHLTQQEEDVLAAVLTMDRCLFPAGNNLGKSFVLGIVALWVFDAVAALPDPDTGDEEQGCILLLPGPDHLTIKDTIWGHILEHALRAEERGWRFAGRRSERSVLWDCGPRWYVRAFAPPKRVGKTVAHTVTGRHHRNMVAIVEEGAGVDEPTWLGIEGMCSGEGNRIYGALNPTEGGGAAWRRITTGRYPAIHLSALDHPHIRERRNFIPGAVDYRKVDDRVRAECTARGPYPKVQPDSAYLDFVYALAQAGAAERGGRTDGIPGHPDGEPHVYRPLGVFPGQILGEFPVESSNQLFSSAAWAASVERWRASSDPDEPPDRVGLDVAREGDDDTTGAPAWGRPAADLLRAWREIRRAAETADRAEAAMANVREKHRVRIGQLEIAPKGDGPSVARWAADRWPRSPFNVDVTGVGSSAYDHLKVVLGRDARDVSFGASPEDPIPDEEYCANLRTQMYVRCAALAREGLLDLPDDPKLREEAMAHKLSWGQRSVTVHGRKEARPVVFLPPKEEIKSQLGRSPDSMDAVVLACLETSLGGWAIY